MATETVQYDDRAYPRGCDYGVRHKGEGAVGCQLSQWMADVSEQWDETGGRKRGDRPNNQGNNR